MANQSKWICHKIAFKVNIYCSILFKTVNKNESHIKWNKMRDFISFRTIWSQTIQIKYYRQRCSMKSKYENSRKHTRKNKTSLETSENSSNSGLVKHPSVWSRKMVKPSLYMALDFLGNNFLVKMLYDTVDSPISGQNFIDISIYITNCYTNCLTKKTIF